MFKIIGIFLISIPFLLVGLFLTSSCVVVDVKQADGPRIVVPVPLFAAKTALAFAPDDAKHVEVPELAEYAGVASAVIDELVDAPDGVLVEVRDKSDHVYIAKEGDDIVIDVDTPSEEVSVTVPLTAVADILESYDGEEIDTREVLSALGTVSNTDLVHVRTEDEEVRVWIW